MRFADRSRGRAFAKDPAVVRFGGRYLLYYTVAPYGDGRAGNGYAMGITAHFFQRNNDGGQTWSLSRIEVGWDEWGPLLP